jgi:type I restriction enzyme S subunit
MASDIIRGQVDLRGCSFISKKQADTLRKGFAKEGDVLLTHKASIGRTAIVPKIDTDYIMLTPQVTYYRIKDSNVLNNHYLRYYFDSSIFQQELNMRAGSGSTRAYIGITDQKMLSVTIPPLPEQRAIASILSALDDKIELNLQMNKTLEEMAMTLYKHWFVDFGPFKDGKFIDSELGLIPEGWEVKKVKDFGTVVTGKTPSQKFPEHFGEEMAFVTPTDFKEYGRHVTHANRYISDSGILRHRNSIIPANSVIVTCIGSDMGKVGISKVACLTNQQINSLKCDNYLFMYCFFKANYEKLRMLAGVGTTMPIINKSSFEGIEVISPPLNILKEFEEKLIDLDDQELLNALENQTLTNLRDTMLPKLISGEVRVIAEAL